MLGYVFTFSFIHSRVDRGRLCQWSLILSGAFYSFGCSWIDHSIHLELLDSFGTSAREMDLKKDWMTGFEPYVCWHNFDETRFRFSVGVLFHRVFGVGTVSVDRFDKHL